MERFGAQAPGTAGQVNIARDAFSKVSDGSWRSVLNTDVSTPAGAIRVPAGMDFRRGQKLCGYDIAVLLDEANPVAAA